MKEVITFTGAFARHWCKLGNRLAQLESQHPVLAIWAATKFKANKDGATAKASGIVSLDDVPKDVVKEYEGLIADRSALHAAAKLIGQPSLLTKDANAFYETRNKECKAALADVPDKETAPQTA